MRFKLNSVLLGLLTAIGTTSVAYGDSLNQAFNMGSADIDVRIRYESVDDGNTATQDADATTIRTRLGFTTGDYYDFKAHMDFVLVNTGGDFFPKSTGYATVADPKVEELNQAWLSYTGIADNTFKIGRQRVILDNARFIGNVGWRQNEQTFDAIAYSNTSIKDVSILLANVQQVNTITGGALATSSNILHVGINNTALGNVSAYAYAIDLDNSSANDTLTIGARLKGASDNILYTAEYAQQSDAADNTSSLSASYIFLEAGYKLDGAKIFIGDEILGSDNGTAGFQTLLATKHAFNGWADKFLTTPADGLNDLYIKGVTKVAGLKLVGVYHSFTADNGGATYGNELDLLLVKPIDKNLKALVKYANYSADSFSTDTQKIWLSLEAKFAQ